MSHNDFANAGRSRRAHQLEDLHTSQVSCSKYHFVLCNQRKAYACRLGDIATGIQHGKRRGRNPDGRKLALNLCPEWQLGIGPIGSACRFCLVLGPSARPAVSLAASTVGIQTTLHPDRPAISTATGLIPPTL